MTDTLEEVEKKINNREYIEHLKITLDTHWKIDNDGKLNIILEHLKDLKTLKIDDMFGNQGDAFRTYYPNIDLSHCDNLEHLDIDIPIMSIKMKNDKLRSLKIGIVGNIDPRVSMSDMLDCPNLEELQTECNYVDPSPFKKLKKMFFNTFMPSNKNFCDDFKNSNVEYLQIQSYNKYNKNEHIYSILSNLRGKFEYISREPNYIIFSKHPIKNA